MLISVSVSGCLGNLNSGSTVITHYEFETGVDVDKGMNDDPAVSFEDDEIHVIGAYGIGNACYSEHLAEPSYDAERDELQIRLTRQHSGSDTCDELFQTVSYRVVVSVDGDLPGTVTVTEDMGEETTAESGFGLLP